MGRPKRSFFGNLLVFAGLIFVLWVVVQLKAFLLAGVVIIIAAYIFLLWATQPKDNKRRKLTMDELTHIIRDKGGVCAECGSDNHLSVDHIRPLAKGGDNDLGNLRVLCRSCNSRKKDKW